MARLQIERNEMRIEFNMFEEPKTWKTLISFAIPNINNASIEVGVPSVSYLNGVMHPI